MVLFGIIDPLQKNVTYADFPDIRDAYAHVGLDAIRTEHGIPLHGLCIVVDAFSLFVAPQRQHYFAIGNKLFAGRAVLYKYDPETGEPRDLLVPPKVCFLPDRKEIERMIELGLIDRPQIAAGGAVKWEWPDPDW